MNEFGGGRSSRPWNFYPSTSDVSAEIPSPPQSMQSSYNYKQEGPWKNFGGTTSINAISFGFVATAILISMFLIMALLEHLFRTSNDDLSSSIRDGSSSLESGSQAKSTNNHNMVMTRYATDLSVVMPGQKYPTCIAQPAPLLPCPREGFRWHSNNHSTFPSTSP